MKITVNWKHIRLKAEESRALIKTAFSIDKTSVYYSYDENNIAANDYPIGVIGGEQRFDFPTVYFAQKRANTLAYDMAVNEYEGKKKQLTSEVSMAYYQLVLLSQQATACTKRLTVFMPGFRKPQKPVMKGELSLP